MPGSGDHLPAEFSSQGTSVSFDGVDIGYLTGFDSQCAAGQLIEVTGIGARIVGSGDDARVVGRYDCTSIDPGTLSFQFFGPPSYTNDDAGKKGTIVFTTPSSSYSGEAILVNFSHAGNVGKWSAGTATFRFTGA